MDTTSYRLPLTQEYHTRGCTVKIDAAANSNRVDVIVFNEKTGYGKSYSRVILPGTDYSMDDVREIKDEINSLIDEFGDPECQEIHFTNQILS